MMKPILLSAAFALAAACGGSDTQGDTANTNKPDLKAPAETACEQEVLLECEEGFVDACALTPESATSHACVEGELSVEEPVTPDEGDTDTPEEPGDADAE